jgi:uncharacterized RDD family membrane protein YckC
MSGQGSEQKPETRVFGAISGSLVTPESAFRSYPASLPSPNFGAAPIGSPYYPSAAAWPSEAETGAALSSFGIPLARWWQRVGSMLIDGLVLGVPLAIMNVIATDAFGTRHLRLEANGFQVTRTLNGGALAIVLLLLTTIGGLYFAILNGKGRGQTVGNRAPNIAVRDATTGEAIGLLRGLLRWLVRFVLYAALGLPGILNDLFPLWDRRRQTLADKAAGSVVVRLR